MQKDFILPNGLMLVDGGLAIVPNVIKVVEFARKRGILIIWVPNFSYILSLIFNFNPYQCSIIYNFCSTPPKLENWFCECCHFILLGGRKPCQTHYQLFKKHQFNIILYSLRIFKIQNRGPLLYRYLTWVTEPVNLVSRFI